ncbi:hypothetical protein EII17_01275 [Clostridiales bacterium COT073_COT-073]|nr:hypothetical protein EII17_01275 [Clostridiales bacterium COT073_COT-073]
MAENKKDSLTSKKELKKQMNGRSAFMFFLFILAFAGLFWNLGKIIWVNGENFKQKVLSQAIQREGDAYIEFKRGEIMERNGIVLASTVQVYKLIFDAKLLNSLGAEKKEAVLELLVRQQIREKSELEKILVEKQNYNYVVLEQEMSYSAFKEIKEAIDTNRVSGLFYEAHNKRQYPYPTLAPELIGFVKGDNVGEGGIEEYYNNMLIGEVGRRYGILNSKSIAVDKEVAATDGYQVMLNIDYSIQKYITDAMTDYLKDHNPKSVTIIVADPRNMEILGLKSFPSFSLDSPYDIPDLELPADVEMVEKTVEAIILQKKKDLLKAKIAKIEEEKSKQAEPSKTAKDVETEKPNQASVSQPVEPDNSSAIKQKDKETLVKMPTLEEITDEEVISPTERASLRKNLLLQNRWKNIALTNGYEPGSIFKAITYAMAEEENKIAPENYYYCSGGLQKASHFIRCHKVQGHGAQTAEQGLSNSCNVVFMDMGEAIGRELFYDYQHKFGFGAITGIDLAGETSQRKNIYEKKDLNETQLATSSFGQGFNVTPIQMITAFSALINGGYLYEPHVVKKVFDTEGNLFEVKDKTLIRQVISEASSLKLRQTLKGVVDEGTGRTAKIAGYEIGGKTATSEKQPRGNGKYTVSFMGFAPIENPEVITLVIVDEPEGAYQDSRIPALIFRNCMEKIMPYLHIFKADVVEEQK